MYDPDDYIDKAYTEETQKLDRLLAQLQDCDLGEWDQDFVDDMTKRVAKFGNEVRVSGLQWEQLERMRKQYL